MKYEYFILPLILTLGCQQLKQEKREKTTTVTDNNIVFQLDFENNKIGKYSSENLTKDVGEVRWMIIKDRASIENDWLHGKVLKVLYPKGAVGPREGGITFDKRIPEANEYYLDYYVKFKKGFEFVLGGKLPGLTSGGEKYTGGTHPKNGEGWSARYMWRENGAMIVYFYHMDNKHEWGDIVEMDTVFESGKWYRITQHIRLNEGDKFNGVMEAWADGVMVTNDRNVRYRLAPLGEINSFYFSTFHGGNTTDWAPKEDVYIYYDDFKVTVQKPQGLE